jgi:hypothetical protein
LGRRAPVARQALRCRPDGHYEAPSQLLQEGELADRNFDDLPVWQRRGTGIYHERFETQGANPITGELVKTERRRLKTDESIPLGVEYDDFIRRLIDAQ